MKPFTIAALLAGSAALLQVPAVGQAQTAEAVDTAVAIGQTPRFIVTFHGARSLDQELGELRSSLRNRAANDQDLARMMDAERAPLEARMNAASQARVAELRSALRMDVAWERQLGTGSDLIRFDPRQRGMQPEAFMDRLRAHPAVASVEFDALMKPLFTPNDTFYSAQ